MAKVVKKDYIFKHKKGELLETDLLGQARVVALSPSWVAVSEKAKAVVTKMKAAK